MGTGSYHPGILGTLKITILGVYSDCFSSEMHSLACRRALGLFRTAIILLFFEIIDDKVGNFTLKVGGCRVIPPLPTPLNWVPILVKCFGPVPNFFLSFIRRKEVGMLATAHWKGQAPKFNTAPKKQELMAFAESIEEKCGVPEVGFGKKGIAEHIQAYFSEQRRYKKRVSLFFFHKT